MNHIEYQEYIFGPKRSNLKNRINGAGAYTIPRSVSYAYCTHLEDKSILYKSSYILTMDGIQKVKTVCEKHRIVGEAGGRVEAEEHMKEDKGKGAW